MPASISGASASTAPAAVCFTSSSTVSRDTARAVDESRDALGVFISRMGARFVGVVGGDMSMDRSAGTTAPSPTKRLHVTCNTPTTAELFASDKVESAAKPCAKLSCPKPAVAFHIAATRSLAALRAAIPTSAHAPHCTLSEARPWRRRKAESESRHALADA